jgi:hypothetical protein
MVAAVSANCHAPGLSTCVAQTRRLLSTLCCSVSLLWYWRSPALDYHCRCIGAAAFTLVNRDLSACFVDWPNQNSSTRSKRLAGGRVCLSVMLPMQTGQRKDQNQCASTWSMALARFSWCFVELPCVCYAGRCLLRSREVAYSRYTG